MIQRAKVLTCRVNKIFGLASCRTKSFIFINVLFYLFNIFTIWKYRKDIKDLEVHVQCILWHVEFIDVTLPFNFTWNFIHKTSKSN